MTHSQVIDKLAMEMAIAMDLEEQQGIEDHTPTYRWFIRQALDIGTNHFTKDMEEVVMITKEGAEAARYKGVTDASHKTGIRQADISAVITGRQHTAGGFKFMKAKDWELVPRPDPDPEKNFDYF